jgi:hypothetical protein
MDALQGIVLVGMHSSRNHPLGEPDAQSTAMSPPMAARHAGAASAIAAFYGSVQVISACSRVIAVSITCSGFASRQ